MKRDNTGVDFNRMLERCREELARGAPTNTGLQLVCNLLHREVDHYNWFGFYFVVPGERMLVLGPYEGEPTDHVRIPFGRGICGQAAEREETFVVDDVSREANYLACSLKTKSEIVVPVYRDRTVVGEIDIDSHTASAFTQEDRRFLEELARHVAPHMPEIPPAE